MTPIMYAIAGNHNDAFLYMVFHLSLPVDTMDMIGQTVLHIACQSNNLDVVYALDHLGYIESAICVKDQHGQTPIMKCVQPNSIKVLKYLCRHTAMKPQILYAKDNRGDTLIDNIRRFGSEEMGEAYTKLEVEFQLRSQHKSAVVFQKLKCLEIYQASLLIWEDL